MHSLSEISRLADERLKEAAALCASGHYDGAFYLAGYVVELTLKGKVCERIGLPDLFNEQAPALNQAAGVADIRRMLKTHNLNVLLILAGLKTAFDADKSANKHLGIAYSLIIERWDEQIRYKPYGHTDPEDMEQIILSLTDQNGLLTWIYNQ